MNIMKTLTLGGTTYEISSALPPSSSAEYNRINVRDYGAVGDGITDDQSAIVEAFAEANRLLAQDMPCEVYFPSGVYGIANGGLTMYVPNGKGGLRICGAGRDVATIKYLDEWKYGGLKDSNNRYMNGWYALKVSPENDTAFEDYDNYIHDVTITGLTVCDANPLDHAWHPDKGDDGKEETRGIGIGWCVRATVTDCNFITIGDEAIDIGNCRNVVVSHNHCIGSPAAGTAGGAISIGDGSVGVVVSGNTIEKSALDETLDNGTVIEKANYGVAVESLYTPVCDIVISGNTILDIHGKGINIAAVNDGASIDNVVITDNVIDGCVIGIGANGQCPKRGVKINGNIISNCSGEAIKTNAVGDITIGGNTIRNIGGSFAVNTAGEAVESRQLISDNIFEDIKYAAVYCHGTTIIKDCLFNGVGTTETQPATPTCAIVKYGGTLTVSGCTLKNIRLYKSAGGGGGVNGGILNADYIEHTDIELVNVKAVNGEDKVNHGGEAIKGNDTKRIIGGNIGGRVYIHKPNAIVQGVTIESTNVGANALVIAANGVSVTGCNININIKDAITEIAGYDGNIFANNIVNRPITVNGANTVAMNMINGVWTDNTRATVSETETHLDI